MSRFLGEGHLQTELKGADLKTIMLKPVSRMSMMMKPAEI